MAEKVGVHLANDGQIDFSQVEGLGLVKGLVRLDLDHEPTDYRELARHLSPGCAVVLRLYWPGYLEPLAFVHKTRMALPQVLDALDGFDTFIEIHNEPNHAAGHEGWGNMAEDAADFQAWFSVVLDGLQPHFQNLGWPGLAVGEWGHGERTWAKACRNVMHLCDWIGVHCYWQTPEQMEDPRLGRNWSWYRARFPEQRLIVTEAGNSSCDNPELPQMTPGRQAAEYDRFAREADVYGVAFYMLGGSENWTGFRIWPETVNRLRGFCGQRSN